MVNNNKNYIKVRDIQQYIDNISEIDEKTNVFYRGQSNIEYGLEPSIFRKKAKEREQEVYLKVLSECSNEFDESMTHIDKLSKMQHYGVPTRLLDVTTNALVALYFACDSEKNKEKDGRVFIFEPEKEYVKTFDSDTICLLSSLPRFNQKVKKKLIKKSKKYIKKKYNKKEVEKLYKAKKQFNEKEEVQRLLHEVKRENPSFENIIEPEDLLNNYFVLPKKDNPRIIRQSGAFIIYGLGDNDVEYSREIIIPHSAKKTILKQLKCCGISKATLHPELYKMSEYIKDCIEQGVEIL